MMSSFLSPDNYMQDPTSQQGFNRYAYCMYNPLKYVDTSGENGNEPQGNRSGNHGSPGGGQDGPNNKRPLIIIRTVTTDNEFSYYNIVLNNNDESYEYNTSCFSELKKFVEENTKYFFIDVGEALDFMYENSFDENMNAYKEIAAWVVDGGIIVQPWYDNTERESKNSFMQIGDNYFYRFDGHPYEIEAQIHTHPNYNNGYIGVSDKDMGLDTIIPVYIIYNSSLYKAGNPAIRIDQIRNINYYNWKKFFKY